MPMYSFIPADEEARKLPPRESVLVPDEMVRSNTSLYRSDEDVKEKNNRLKCDSCDKTYKNKNSLADHKRKYHSNLPLRLFPNRSDSNESDSDSTMVRHSRKRKILIDEDDNKSISSNSEDSTDSDNAYSRRRSKVNEHSRAIISHPPKKDKYKPRY